MSSEAFAERILRFIQAKGYRPKQLRELADALDIGSDEHGDFRAACKALMKTGRVVLGAQSALMLPGLPSKVVGTFRGNRRGFGFIVPDVPNAHGDLFVPEGKTGGAVTGDTVSARVLKRGKRDGQMLYEGRITSIVRRGRNRFVGVLRQKLGQWYVVPDGNALHVPIAIDDPGAKNARAGDQVTVEITQYPDSDVEARGVLLHVLGKSGEPDVDTLSIIEQYQLPVEFPSAVLKQATDVATGFDPEKAATDREDLASQTIITIDPPNARDFDDAISVVAAADGTYELGVHIADVAHFVPAGGPLDTEARLRSNSVYLPNRVISMLPESLSNGVCSLQERQPRLTRSAFITFDRQGNVVRTRFANTTVRTTKRLTYEQASKVLDGKPGRTGAKVVALLGLMDKLAKLIRRRRLRDGMLVLDLPDTELVYDDAGRVIEVVEADTSFSHTIIEMFMVEANDAVARLFAETKVPILRRIHDEPSALAWSNLRKFLAVLGHKMPPEPDRKAVQTLLDKTRDEPGAFAVHFAALRSMQRAEYAPLQIGHYALASEHYCHFTSPIRRYADLMVHRALDRHIRSQSSALGGDEKPPSEKELIELGHLCSGNERRAESAERELKLVLVLRLIADKHLGSKLDGLVTGVANVGLFVQLDRFLVDGLLRYEDLGDDWWEQDVGRGVVVGQRSGTEIRIGDRLRVAITRVDIGARQLELTLVGTKDGRHGGRGGMGRGRPSGKRKKNVSRGPKKRRRKGRR